MAGIILKEFGDLTNLMKAIPHKEQKGLFAGETSWTCVDFSNDLVAVGTDSGWLYLYDRFEEVVKHRLTTKPCDRNPLTKVKLKRSVEYVVAMGTASGLISIFQLPAPLAGVKGKLQAFSIRDLHHSAITSLEWSQNAMKLFSGDEDGVVVCTEIDYLLNQSRSYVMCKEPHSIVQLSYGHKTLLISTRWRTVLCKADDVMNVTQVGKKDRKTLGPFGAVFLPGSVHPQDAVIYCARPNLNLWKADITGTVALTVIFKMLTANLDKPVGVSMLSSKEAKDPSQMTLASPHFSQLFVFRQQLLFSYFENGLFVLNPRSGQVLCYHATLPSVRDVAVNDEEVLLLMNSDRGALRFLAKNPFRAKLPSSSIGSSPKLASKATHSHTTTKEVLSGAIGKVNPSLLTKSLFGVLKEIGNVMEPVQDGISSERSNQEATTPETGEEATRDAAAAETDELITQNELASIPIVQLDPAEIMPLRVDSKVPYMEELKPLSCPAVSETGVAALTESQTADDEIVFESMRKKKVKRKQRNRLDHRLQNPDAVSISSGDSIQRERSLSPSDIRRRTASPHIQPSVILHHRSVSPVDVPWRSVSSFPEESFASHQRSVGAFPSEQPLTSMEACFQSAKPDLPSVEPVALDSVLVSGKGAETDVGSICRPCDFGVPSKVPVLHQDKAICTAAAAATQNAPPVTSTVDDSCNQNLDLIMSREVGVSDAFVKSQKTEIGLSSSHSVNKPQDDSCQKATMQRLPNQTETQKTGHEAEFKNLCTKDCSLQEADGKPEHLSMPDTLKHQPTGSHIQPKKVQGQSEVTPRPSVSTDAFRVATLASSTDFQSIYHSTHYDAREEPLESSVLQPELKLPQQSVDVFAQSKITETWSEVIGPGSIKSLCLTNKHAWCVDRLDRIYYNHLSKPGKWTKIDETGQYISVSPNGYIIWVLRKNSIYAASKTSAKTPAGSDYREIARDVSSFCVDDHVAWYSKLNGEVLMQKDLRKERTSYRAVKVACDYHVTNVVSGRGVVWAITDDLMILVRVGIESGREEGIGWVTLKGPGNQPLAFTLSIGSNGLVWVMDISGQIWFTTHVNSSNPEGSGLWWEIAVADSSVMDVATSGKSWSIWELPQTLTWSASGAESCGTIAANANGEVWVSFGKGQSIFVSDGSITGHRWELATPSGMLATTKWRRISCCDGDKEGVNVWLEQSNGDIFCINSTASGERVLEIAPPLFHDAVLSLVATSSALWCVTVSGKMFVRKGMSTHCLQGLEWVNIDLSQLGNVKIINLSISLQNVWAVDSLGNVYLRIGVKPPSNDRINQAWVEVGRENLQSGTRITQVASSPNSAMVWAIDSKKNVYIRGAVTESLPVGRKWINVSGASVESIHLSNHHVYALNGKGDILVRCGITGVNPFGDFWKRIPGKVHQIAVNSADDLWSLDKDDQLYRRHTNSLEIASQSHLLRHQAKLRKDSIDAEWEII